MTHVGKMPERWQKRSSTSKMPSVNWTAVHILSPLKKLCPNSELTLSKVVAVLLLSKWNTVACHGFMIFAISNPYHNPWHSRRDQIFLVTPCRIVFICSYSMIANGFIFNSHFNNTSTGSASLWDKHTKKLPMATLEAVRFEIWR